ncbi:DUF1203 domain-containing protein [Edaphobacter sp. HDX4]|uniref:DUF1203 domain-containing protein n=1 Tax=Edaphobacter sp. HDX4 TaxID=2794064 RepID=UPI002FE621B1
MKEIRVIAVSTETVKKVLATKSSPGYGHPAHTEVARGHGPCRHCLKPFRIGEENRTLFTFNPFSMLAAIPAPGPIFVHAELCERFDEESGYPEQLVMYPVVLDGYDGEQRLLTQRRAVPGQQQPTIASIFEDAAVRYVIVREGEAGCFDFRVERMEVS